MFQSIILQNKYEIPFKLPIEVHVVVNNQCSNNLANKNYRVESRKLLFRDEKNNCQNNW